MPFWYTEDVNIAELLPPTRYAHGLNEGVGIIAIDFTEDLCWYRRCSPNALIRNLGYLPI